MSMGINLPKSAKADLKKNKIKIGAVLFTSLLLLSISFVQCGFTLEDLGTYPEILTECSRRWHRSSGF